MKVEAIPVKVKRDVYDKVKTYATQRNQPVAQVIAEALVDWLDTVGAARLESDASINVVETLMQRANVVCITDAMVAQGANA